MNLKLLRRKIVHYGRVFNTIVDDVQYPSGRQSIREIADHPGGSVTVPVFSDERIILIRQHRYPFNEFILECPAGKLNANEDPLFAAQRELEEETGYRAETWRKLSAIYSTPGFCNEIDHIFLATDLFPVPTGHRREEGEETMTVEIIPLVKTIEMIERGEIVDAKTICGIFMAERVLRSR